MKTTKLEKLSPCIEAVQWVKGQKSAKAAWQNCERGDRMLWLLGKLSKNENDRKLLTLATCECVRPSLKFVPEDEKRPLIAIETAEKWAKGKATLQEVKKAAAAAYDARAAYAYTAAYATSAATASAAYATSAAAASAAYAAAATATAATAAAAAAATYAASAAYAARKETLKQCAEIVRKHYPEPPKL